MKDKISLSSRKSRIALILVLILVLQVILPIMKVQAETYDISFDVHVNSSLYNKIFYPGDVINAANSRYAILIKVKNSQDKWNDIASGTGSVTVPENYILVCGGVGAGDWFKEESTVSAYQTFRVSFDSNGGNEDYSNTVGLIYRGRSYEEMAPYGSKMFTSNTDFNGEYRLPWPTPTREGYSFDGWYTAPEGGMKVTKYIIFTGTSDVQLYAHWVLNDASYKAETTNFTYDGTEITAVTNMENVTVSGTNSATDVGNYTATIIPQEGHAWVDGGTNAKTVNWSISPATINANWGDPSTFTYNKQGQAPTVTTPVDGVNGEKVNITRTTEINKGNYVSTASISSVTGGRENVNNYVLSNNTQEFSITAKSLYGQSIAIGDLSEDTFTYDGTEHKPTVTIIDHENGDYTLVKDTDYTITYDNNRNAGEAKVTITGIGNYGGEFVKTYTINKQKATVTADDKNIIYGSDNISLTHTDENVIAGETLNVNISREEGDDAGTYTIYVGQDENANPNYDITFVNGTYTIEGKPISVRIEIPNNQYKYVAGENEPEITVYNTEDDKKVDSSEYNVTYSNNDKVGTATIKVTDNGTGNYIVANAEKNFTIINGDITDKMLKFEDNEVTYDTEEHSINITGELPGGAIEYSTDGENFSETLPTYTDVGEYTIYYRASKENYNDKTGRNILTINKKEIKKPTIVIENQVYTGEKVEPEIVIKDGDKIVPSSEYTVEYSNNIKPGIANVIIKNVDGGNYIIETTNTTFAIVDPGTVKFIEPKTPNANNAKVTESPEEVIAKINLTEEDVDNIKHGKNIDVYLEVKDISNSVANSDKKAIEEKLGNSNLGLYLDVSLFKKVTGEEATKITETKKPISISFELPDELINNNSKVERSYKILRLHDGVVEELDVKVNGKTATFETDKFSTYALTYTDTSLETSSSPKTGDNITMYVIMFIISLLGIRTLSVSNKRKSKKARR